MSLYPVQLPIQRKIIAKTGNVFDNVQRAISFNQGNRRVDKMPVLQKRALEEKSKQRFMSALQSQRNKSMQTSGSVFAERIEKAKNSNFEMEPKKMVRCFLDGHGNYDSNLISFKIKSL